MRPSADDESVPPVAALCTWTRLIRAAAPILDGSLVRLAAVAGDFPSGRAPIHSKLQEVESAVASGADEIDTVINRKLLLEGHTEDAYRELVALREAAGSATLKVILETGELADLQMIRQGALIALVAGADFVKSSTGKMVPGATPEAAVVMCDAIKDFYARFARPAGLKVAGGIRTTEDALVYLQIVRETLSEEWVEPRRFRIGASSLVKDLVGHLGVP